MQTADIERIVLPPKYLEELRAFPDGKLSHRLSIVDRHLGQYTRLDTVANSQLHRDVSAVQLSSQLGRLFVIRQHTKRLIAVRKNSRSYEGGARLRHGSASGRMRCNMYALLAASTALKMGT